MPPQALRSRSVDGNDAQCAGALRFLAQTGDGGGVLVGHGDGARLGHDLRASILDARRAAGIKRGHADVDGGGFDAHVEAERGQRVQLLEDGREQVLAGVLLHVIEAARPVDAAGDLVGSVEGRVQDVRDAILLLDHLDDAGDTARVSEIERLAAGGGIERGAVEIDAQAAGVGSTTRARNSLR